MDACKHTSAFMATVAIEKMLIPNVYTFTFGFRVNTGDFDEQNVAFGRIKHLIEARLSNSLIIKKTHPRWKTLSNVDNNLMVMPGDPMDFPIACALFKKMQSVVEGRFDIVSLELNSLIGDQVDYLITEDNIDEIDAFLDGGSEKDRWWNDIGPNINKTQAYVDWKPIGLDWQISKKGKTAGQPKIARIVQFNPKVVEGGGSAKKD